MQALTAQARGVLQKWSKESARPGEAALFPNVRGAGSAPTASSRSWPSTSGRQQEVSIIGIRASVAARAEAQRCDGAAASGRRLRAMVARIDRNDAALPACPTRTQASSPRKAQTVQTCQANRLPPSDHLLAFLQPL